MVNISNRGADANNPLHSGRLFKNPMLKYWKEAMNG